jgi:hypothetical protein
MLLLPAALVVTMDWAESPRRDRRLLLLSAVLLVGLFLSHARVAAFAACFIVVYLLSESARLLHQRSLKPICELWVRTAALGIVSITIAVPWLTQVVASLRAIAAAGGGLRAASEYNAISQSFFWVPRNRELVILAAMGTVWGLWRNRRSTIWIVGWLALVGLLVNPAVIGLPTTTLFNNASASISLYLPLAVLVGQGMAAIADHVYQLWRTLSCRHRGRRLLHIVRGFVVGAALACGWTIAWGAVSLVNPATILVHEADLEAMDWICENTAPDALFLINASPWQLGIYTGTDAGYWITELAGRRNLVPPVPYTYGKKDYVQRVSDQAQIVASAGGAQDPALGALIHQEGITHIYIGVRGGPLRPDWFADDPGYRTVYESGGAWVFEVVEGQASGTPSRYGVPQTQAKSE